MSDAAHDVRIAPALLDMILDAMANEEGHSSRHSACVAEYPVPVPPGHNAKLYEGLTEPRVCTYHLAPQKRDTAEFVGRVIHRLVTDYHRRQP